MSVLLLTNIHPAVVHVVVIASTPQAECAMVELVSISVSIVAQGKMYAIVGTDIGCEVHGCAVVEVVTVGIMCPDAHSPRAVHHIKGTVEVVAVHEPAVLVITEHIHKVLVAHVEQVVVIVDSVVISIHHVVDDLVHLV